MEKKWPSVLWLSELCLMYCFLSASSSHFVITSQMMSVLVASLQTCPPHIVSSMLTYVSVSLSETSNFRDGAQPASKMWKIEAEKGSVASARSLMFIPDNVWGWLSLWSTELAAYRQDDHARLLCSAWLYHFYMCLALVLLNAHTQCLAWTYGGTHVAEHVIRQPLSEERVLTRRHPLSALLQYTHY